MKDFLLEMFSFNGNANEKMMSQSIWIFLLPVFLLGSSCSAVKNAGKEVSALPSLSLEVTLSIVTTLSSDEMEGRRTGSQGIEKAAQFIEQFFSNAGIAPFFEDSYRDTLHVKNEETYNIVGLLPGTGKEYILISAHYDHIGGKAIGGDSIYNGANDNASGVAAVLQIARALSGQRFEKNVIFALFTAEELGLIGSKHLSKKLREMQIDLQYMINFEMIGSRFNAMPGQTYITGYDISNLAEEINVTVKDNFVLSWDQAERFMLFQRSDNFPFYQAFNIPAQTISSYDFNSYPYYHHPEDETEALDVENMHIIIQSATQAVTGLLNQNVEIRLKQ